MSTAMNTLFPLTPISTTRVDTLRKKPLPHPPSTKSDDSSIQDTMREPESTMFWEKGLFVDLYA